LQTSTITLLYTLKVITHSNKQLEKIPKKIQYSQENRGKPNIVTKNNECVVHTAINNDRKLPKKSNTVKNNVKWKPLF